MSERLLNDVCETAVQCGVGVVLLRCVSLLKTRVNVLLCVDRLLDCLDKMAIIDDVMPFLADIQTTDVDVIMTVVGQLTSIITRGDGKCRTANLRGDGEF